MNQLISMLYQGIKNMPAISPYLIVTDVARAAKIAPITSGIESPVALYVYCDDVDKLFAQVFWFFSRFV